MSINGKYAYRFVYLKSQEWKDVRLEALVKAKALCKICGVEDFSNDAHHIYYPKSFWKTTAEQLVVLCRPCHNVVHALLKSGKKTTKESVDEWHAIIRALRVWRSQKAKWIEDPDAEALATPKQLREAYGELKKQLIEASKELEIRKRPMFDIKAVLSENNRCFRLVKAPDEIKKERRVSKDKRGPNWCRCCRSETKEVQEWNIFEHYGETRKLKDWKMCKECWGEIQNSIQWPQTSKEAMRVIRKAYEKRSASLKEKIEESALHYFI